MGARVDILEQHVEEATFLYRRLRRSCRRLIWVNPLLRYSEFQAKASGVRAMLPQVDEFRPIHNLRSMADLVAALAEDKGSTASDPRKWLRAA